MKKLSLVIALALILSLAVPAFSAPFSDVPAGHWAREALDRVVEAGIITGYPDGTFRGTDNINRYQMAVIITRILDWVIENVPEPVDINAIKAEFRAMGLTDRQAEEVLIMIRALTMEFKDDIKALDQTLDTQVAGLQQEIRTLRSDLMVLMGEHFDLEFSVLQLEDQVLDLAARVDEEVAALEARIDGLEAQEPTLTFSLRPSFDYEFTQTYGAGVPWENPFVHRTSGLYWFDHDIDDEQAFDYALPLGIHGNVGGVKMDLTLNIDKDALAPDRYVTPVTGVEFGFLTGTVETDGFAVKFTDYEPFELTSYIYSTFFRMNRRTRGYNLTGQGGVVTFDQGRIALFKEWLGNDHHFAAEYNFGILDVVNSTLFVGAQDPFDANNNLDVVVGLKNSFDVGPATVGVEVGMSDYANLDYFVKGNLGLDLNFVKLSADYTHVDNFTPLLGAAPTAGYGVKLVAPIAFLELDAWYEDKAAQRAGGGLVITDPLEFGPAQFEGHFKYAHDFTAGAMRLDERLAKISADFGIADLALTYDHIKGPGRGWQFNWWVPTWGQVAERHRVIANLGISPVDMIDISVDAFYNIEGTTNVPVDLRSGVTITPMDWISLGGNVRYNMQVAPAALSYNVFAGLAPAPLQLVGFEIAPKANVKYFIDSADLNYDLGLDIDRPLDDKFTWSTSAVYDYRQASEYAWTGRGYVDGTWLRVETGINYNSIADLSFEYGKYDSISDPADDYTYKALKAGISLSF